MLLSTVPYCCREAFNSWVRRACKPAVFAASFQPLGAAASFQRGKRAKRLYFHTVSKTCVAPRGSYSAIFGCLVETLLIASFASRIADELNLVLWGVRYRLGRATFPPPRFSLSHTCLCACALQKLFAVFIFAGRHPHPRKTRNFARRENFPLSVLSRRQYCSVCKFSVTHK